MMSTSRLDEVLRLCGNVFRDCGYTVPARGRIFLEVDGDSLLWVGLPNFGQGHVVDLRPNVGVHHVGVMRAFAELRGESYTKGQFATYAISLEMLSGGQNRFVFDKTDDEAEAVRMVEAVSAYAVPWVERNAGLEELVNLMKKRQEGLGGVPEQIAVALLLAGRTEELFTYLEERQVVYEMDSVNPGVVSKWRRFAAKVRERMAGGSADT